NSPPRAASTLIPAEPAIARASMSRRVLPIPALPSMTANRPPPRRAASIKPCSAATWTSRSSSKPGSTRRNDTPRRRHDLSVDPLKTRQFWEVFGFPRHQHRPNGVGWSDRDRPTLPRHTPMAPPVVDRRRLPQTPPLEGTLTPEGGRFGV